MNSPKYSLPLLLVNKSQYNNIGFERLFIRYKAESVSAAFTRNCLFPAINS